MRSLMIGRFQPFHNGHLEVVRKIVSEADAVIIGIGSAQYSHTPENPFTAGERHLMISKSLEAEDIHAFYLVPIVDVNRYSIWVSHVETLVPPFDRVYTNNPLTRRLFKEDGYDVSGSPLYDREKYSGKEIRDRIRVGAEWENLVPSAVVEVLKEIDGINRIKELE